MTTTRLTFAAKTLEVLMYRAPDGQIEQFDVYDNLDGASESLKRADVLFVGDSLILFALQNQPMLQQFFSARGLRYYLLAFGAEADAYLMLLCGGVGGGLDGERLAGHDEGVGGGRGFGVRGAVQVLIETQVLPRQQLGREDDLAGVLLEVTDHLIDHFENGSVAVLGGDALGQAVWRQVFQDFDRLAYGRFER